MRTVLCECGCGTELPPFNTKGKPSRFAPYHHARLRKISPKQREAMIEGKRRAIAARGRAPRHWERFKDPRYKVWRLSVFERDAYMCQHCGYRGSEGERGFAAHHIQEWAKYPDLRYEVENGLTLCRNCHDKVHGLNRKPVDHTPRPCACGCGTMIDPTTLKGKPRRFVSGHNARGLKRSPESIAKSAQKRKGLKRSEESIAKLAAKLRGRYLPAEQKAKISAALTGRPKSPEAVAKSAQARRGRKLSPEQIEGMRQRARGKHPSTEARQRLSDALKGRKQSPEHIAKRIASRRAKKDGAY